VPSRVFELRTYKSHNDRAGAKKIEMFEKGEFPIFRRVGLNWVFFGKDVVGNTLPSLTYLARLREPGPPTTRPGPRSATIPTG
jgi:hypothetical protein